MRVDTATLVLNNKYMQIKDTESSAEAYIKNRDREEESVRRTTLTAKTNTNNIARRDNLCYTQEYIL